MPGEVVTDAPSGCRGRCGERSSRGLHRIAEPGACAERHLGFKPLFALAAKLRVVLAAKLRVTLAAKLRGLGSEAERRRIAEVRIRGTAAEFVPAVNAFCFRLSGRRLGAA
jgi:hypothetical protein